MKKVILIFLISSCLCCKKETLTFPVLDVNPLINSLKKNKVKHYSIYTTFKGSTVHIDSFNINKEGFVISEICKKGQFNEEYFVYDSLNRVVEHRFQNDTEFDFKSTYKIDKKRNEVKRYFYFKTNESLEKKPSNLVLYKFDKTMSVLLEEIQIYLESKDTFSKTEYFYNPKNKIATIKRYNFYDNYETVTTYLYESDTILKQVIEDGKVHYVSFETGLIDSVKRRYPEEKIIYKYSFY